LAADDVTAQPRKVAIITGQGMGAALVDAYRGLNYAVVANSRSITRTDDPGVAAVAGDIAEPATADRIVATAIERFGRVDTLINNAGVFISKPFTEYTVADYEFVTAVNLTGFFHITQRAIAQMPAQGQGGHVVDVTTTLVEHANSKIPAGLAALTKGGLAAVTRSRSSGGRMIMASDHSPAARRRYVPGRHGRRRPRDLPPCRWPACCTQLYAAGQSCGHAQGRS